MAAFLRQGVSRIAGSVLQRTQAAVSSPAIAEERRRLVPRRFLNTGKHAPGSGEEELQTKFGHLKRHQICWELIKMIPGRKIINVCFVTCMMVAVTIASREVREDEKREAEKREAEKRKQEWDCL